MLCTKCNLSLFVKSLAEKKKGSLKRVFAFFLLLAQQRLKMPFSNLDSDSGLQTLDSYLLDKSYIEGCVCCLGLSIEPIACSILSILSRYHHPSHSPYLIHNWRYN